MRIEMLHTIYWKLYDAYWVFISKHFPVYSTKKRFRKCLGYDLDLKNPRTLNEKMQWLKLNTYWHNQLVCQCADKYAVRAFVEKKGCSEILNELYAVYETPAEIEWGGVPHEFVLKCNHGSGGNIICHDRDSLNREETVEKLNKWMSQEFGLMRAEYSYEGIPRKIICERFIETQDGKPPKDYKIFCSYGKPKLIFVASDRYDGNTKFDYYTPDWEWIPVKNGHPNAGDILPRPEKLDEMLNYACKLSEDFPIVRVDLYCEFGKIIFGELTFLHFGGVTPFDPPEFDRKFGDLFPLTEFEK